MKCSIWTLSTQESSWIRNVQLFYFYYVILVSNQTIEIDLHVIFSDTLQIGNGMADIYIPAFTIPRTGTFTVYTVVVKSIGTYSRKANSLQSESKPMIWPL
jgi:hypothetical protein